MPRHPHIDMLVDMIYISQLQPIRLDFDSKRGFFGLYYNTKLYYIERYNFQQFYNLQISLFEILYVHFYVTFF